MVTLRVWVLSLNEIYADIPKLMQYWCMYTGDKFPYKNYQGRFLFYQPWESIQYHLSILQQFSARTEILVNDQWMELR